MAENQPPANCLDSPDTALQDCSAVLSTLRDANGNRSTSGTVNKRNQSVTLVVPPLPKQPAFLGKRRDTIPHTPPDE